MPRTNSQNDIKLKSAIIAGNNIFQTIRKNGPILRSEIATLTGMSRSTISLHIDKLLKTKLIKEEGIDENGDKRKNRYWNRQKMRELLSVSR